MKDEAEPTAPKKKGGKFKKIAILGGGATLLLGGGAAAGMYASGMGLAGQHGPVEDPNMPKLVLKDGSEAKSVAHKPGAKDDDIPADPGKYKASYFIIEQNFTSNLRDSDGFVQVALGVSTYYDQRVIDRLKEHEMAIRSAVLMALADQDAFVISTPEGKAALQKSLKGTMNEVLRKKEGFGGIADVYFTSFIIQ